jgi:hypothetical protein
MQVGFLRHPRIRVALGLPEYSKTKVEMPQDPGMNKGFSEGMRQGGGFVYLIYV